MFDSTPSRRKFVTHLAGLASATALFPKLSHASPAADSAASPGDEPEAWLKGLTGKHRQLFHSHDNYSNGLEYALRYKTAYPKEYGVSPSEVNSVLAAHGKTGLINFVDAAWQKYGFAKSFDVKDPATKALATHNIYAAGDEDNPGVREALAGGVIVLACHTMIRGVSAGLAKDKKFGTAEEIERDLIASLIPGVVLVPAMVIAIGRAQEQRCAYLFTG